MTESTLLTLAARLSADAGCATPVALERLAGGKNNRVFRVDYANGPAAILKSYFHDPRDARDRLHAEWSFLQHAWERGVRIVPQPLAREPAAHAALYSFLPGRKLNVGEPAAEHVRATLDFIVATNAQPRSPDALPAGSEACFSVGEHLARIDIRVGRLAALAVDAPRKAEAERLIAKHLTPAWSAVRSRIQRACGGLETPIEPSGILASPSDLGFHNAVVDDAGTLRFFDFEYAGRDDPAKLVGDFFCCPEIPAPIDQFGAFVDGLCARLDLSERTSYRARLLLDAYRIKWTCIILNDFLPVDEARRAFALPEAREARCAAQLDKARAKLAELSL